MHTLKNYITGAATTALVLIGMHRLASSIDPLGLATTPRSAPPITGHNDRRGFVALNDATLPTDFIALNDATLPTDYVALNDATLPTDVALNDATLPTDYVALNDATLPTDVVLNDATLPTDVVMPSANSKGVVC